MCLELSKPLKRKVKYGYKVFRSQPDGQLYGQHRDRYSPKPCRRWLRANNIPERLYFTPSLRGRYPNGWHVFTSLTGARKWLGFFNYWETKLVIKKVKVQDVHTYGSQSKINVIVCDRIFILKGDVK